VTSVELVVVMIVATVAVVIVMARSSVKYFLKSPNLEVFFMNRMLL
jgi:hypothetical protein